MSIIKKIMDKIKLLEIEVNTLRTQLKSAEKRIIILSNNNLSIAKAVTPNITRSLDSNNIWMGEKGETGYEHHAKLEVNYDIINDKWLAGVDIRKLDEDVPDYTKLVALTWDETEGKYIAYLRLPYSIYYPD